MSDNLWRNGDGDNAVLRKILNTLQFGIANPSSQSQVQTIVNNATNSVNNSTTAGTSVSGNVGGYTGVVRAAPTCTSGSAYSAGNCVGGLMQLTNFFRVPGTGILESLIVTDSSNQAAAMSLLLFVSNPTGQGSFAATDKTAFTFGNANILLQGIVNIAAADYTVVNSTAIAMKTGLGIAIRGQPSNLALYAALVTSGTPTWASTTPLNLFLGVLLD